MSFSLVPGFAQRYPKDEGDLLSGLDGPVIESCCTTLEEARSAQARGADRIELCTDLSVGGVTPPRDLVERVVNSLSIPVNVLIRPAPSETDAGVFLSRKHATLGTIRGRGPSTAWEGSSEARRSGRETQSVADDAGRIMGFEAEDFVYADEAIAQMIEEIAFCKSVGAAGIVVGALTPSGAVDLVAMRRLVAAAQPLPVTFHRAYDVCTEDPFEALERIIDLGCARLLTSGRAATAWEGRGLLSQLVRRAGDRLIVMPGRGVTPANLSDLSAFTHAPEYHGTQLP